VLLQNAGSESPDCAVANSSCGGAISNRLSRTLGLKPDWQYDRYSHGRSYAKQFDVFTGERRALERGISRLQAQIRLAAGDDGDVTTRMLDLNNQVEAAERRVSEIDARLAELEAERVDAPDVTAAFADFDNVWTALSPREQARVLNLLVRRVDFDAADGTIAVTFHATGIRALADGALTGAEEAA